MRQLLSLFLSLIFCSISLLADDAQPQRGTLPDGTPFRVDAQGNQIVDYIAELEAAVDNLNRRIHGLEGELEAKQGTIERLQARPVTSSSEQQASKQESEIREKTLVNTESAVSNFPGVNGSVSEERFKNIEAQLVSTQAQLESTQRQLQQSQESIKAQGGDLQALYQKSLTRQAELETQLNNVNIQHRASLSARDAEISRLQMVLTDKDISIQQLKRDLIRTESIAPRITPPTNSNTAQLRIPEPPIARATQVTSVETEIVTPKVRENESYSSSRNAPLMVVPVRAKESGLAEEPRASIKAPTLSVARERAVSEVRAGLINEISQLKGQISRRGALYNEYTKQPSVRVSFTLSRLQSSRGYTLVTITDKIRAAQRIGELAELSRDIDQIRTRVRDDIDLIERMMKY